MPRRRAFTRKNPDDADRRPLGDGMIEDRERDSDDGIKGDWAAGGIDLGDNRCGHGTRLRNWHQT